MAKNLFNRYTWLVDTIYRSGRITFEEINERWLRNETSEGEEIPLRTFRQELLSHGAEIEMLSSVWFRNEFSEITKAQNELYDR